MAAGRLAGEINGSRVSIDADDQGLTLRLRPSPRGLRALRITRSAVPHLRDRRLGLAIRVKLGPLTIVRMTA